MAEIPGAPGYDPAYEEKRLDPSTPSSDYLAMIDDWTLIADIRAGWRAIRAKGQTYLPKYEGEDDASYTVRLKCTPWRPEFVDALRNLVSKPFTRPVKVNDAAPDAIQGKLIDAEEGTREGGLVDDIDGKGNDLHVFARDVFADGVAAGLRAIYVAAPISDAVTVAEERAANVRPYWVNIDAANIIALYTRMVGGIEVVEHIRMREFEVVRDGFAEKRMERIRVVELDALDRPVWWLYEKHFIKDTGKWKWEIIKEGALMVGNKPYPEIPIALFFTGQRSGTYQVKPPMADVANMQMELYRAGSRKEEIVSYAGSPMLKCIGVNRPAATRIDNPDGTYSMTPTPQVVLGPRTIFFSPPPTGTGIPPGDYDFIQPNAANIVEVRSDYESITDDLRRLALQPETPQSGRATATAAAIEAAKAHSAVEVMANGLAVALTLAMRFTTQWLALPDTVSVTVTTDFGADFDESASLTFLTELRKNRDLSGPAIRREAVRRSMLDPNFSEETNQREIDDELEGLQAEDAIDPRTGKPVNPPPPVIAPPPAPAPPAPTPPPANRGAVQ
jgi:hypothetical protein